MMKEKMSFCKKNDSVLKDRLRCSCQNYSCMTECAFYRQVASPIMTSNTTRYTTMCKWLVVWSTKPAVVFECVSREAHLNMKVEEL